MRKLAELSHITSAGVRSKELEVSESLLLSFPHGNIVAKRKLSHTAFLWPERCLEVLITVTRLLVIQ